MFTKSRSILWEKENEVELKQLIIKIKWTPFDFLNKLIMKIYGFRCGHGLTTYGKIFFRGTGEIVLGNQVTITSCRETNPIGGDTKTVIYARGNSKIIIGNHVGISNCSIIALNQITIEDNVMIGGNCKIYDNDFHPISYIERMQSPNLGIKSAPILIKDGAFIGAHSIILKGVTIGKHSIIGAGSVVTKAVPDGEIWAGNPARFIRKLEG